MNTQIDITENKTTTLATAGLYCDRDIDVNVAVSHTACFDGTMSGEYVDNNLTTLREGAFIACENLTQVSLPNCVEFSGEHGIGRYMYNCKSITTLELPSLQTIGNGNYCFYGLENIERIDLPELTTIDTFAGTFWNCKKVKVINLPKLSGSSISNYAFRYCYVVEAIILGGDTLNPLTNANALNNANSACIFYVPDNLVDDYKAADNWKTYASRIKGISQLPKEAEQ